ncbi:hypothetical protein FOCG_11878 [Fusarium oxysporum f. sp. radicis-lycopersici 26381]|nr:hypothetical protein FOCG_11878 [Fusarium oxysporum f. sp. radicis-lycopersici 26381]
MPTWPTPGRQVVVHGIVRNYKGLGIEPEGAVEQVTCRLPPKSGLASRLHAGYEAESRLTSA